MENLPGPGCLLGVTILFDGNAAERSGCGHAGDSYRRHFNEERPHQGLDNLTPDDVLCGRKPLAKVA